MDADAASVPNAARIENDGSLQAPTPAHTAGAAARTPRRRRRLGGSWHSLDIQSKLLVMLLFVSILSAVIAGYAGYRSGSRALRTSAYERLDAQRVSKAREVTSYVARLRTAVVLNSANATAQDAMRDFTAGFNDLANARLTPRQSQQLESYYAKTFVPSLAANSDGEPNVDSYLPRNTAERYLQAHYTDRYTDFDKAIKLDDAGDRSSWSAAHAKYHGFFRTIVERYKLEDAMLVDPKGNVVYTAYKGVDLGTNILTGPYASSATTAAFRDVLRANAVDSARITDFAPYQPSSDKPTAFAFSPIGANGRLSGVLMVQLPVDAINDIMTNGGSSAKTPAAAAKAWSTSGFGKTGETFLLGPDGVMRSTSRLFVQDPQLYKREVVANGTPAEVADRAIANGTTIGYQPLRGPEVDAVIRGKSGTTVKASYLGQSILNSYQPLTIPDVHWAIFAQIDEAEAFAPIHDLLRNLALATLALILVVCVASLLLAQVFVRPVKALVSGVRRVASGDLGSRVQLHRGDEFGDLADAFNDMAGNLQTKQELLDDQLAENERLLLSMMPADVAKRYRGGDAAIAEEHQDVTVVFATLGGFDEFSRHLPAERSVSLLNELAVGFESAAQRIGIERVRILRSGYIASCGLAVPRIDHSLRSVEFANEMVAIVERFNAQHDAQLSLRAGIDTGSVTSGLVGGNAVYDMWGETVDLAFGIQSISDQAGVYVTDRVYDQLREAYHFAEAGDIDTKTGRRMIWKFEGTSARA